MNSEIQGSIHNTFGSPCRCRESLSRLKLSDIVHYVGLRKVVTESHAFIKCVEGLCIFKDSCLCWILCIFIFVERWWKSREEFVTQYWSNIVDGRLYERDVSTRTGTGGSDLSLNNCIIVYENVTRKSASFAEGQDVIISRVVEGAITNAVMKGADDSCYTC